MRIAPPHRPGHRSRPRSTSTGLLLGVLLTGVAVAFSLAPSPAMAAERAPKPTAPSVRTHLEARQLTQRSEATKILRRAMTRVHGRPRLDYAKAVKVARASDVRRFARGFRSAGGTIIHVPRREAKWLSRIKPLPQPWRSSHRCRGVDQLHRHWWGYRLDLDSCVIARILELGMGFSTVAGAIGVIATHAGVPAGPIIELVVVVVSLGTYLLTRCSSSKRGVRIYGLLYATPLAWCRSQ